MIIILLKFPASEIFVPDKAEADEGKTTPFRGRASTIGNGQIPRYSFFKGLHFFYVKMINKKGNNSQRLLIYFSGWQQKMTIILMKQKLTKLTEVISKFKLSCDTPKQRPPKEYS